MRAHRFASLSCVLLTCTLLAACGGDKSGANGAQGDDSLPKPAAAGQSVTGMPDPGVASTQPPPASVQAPDIVEVPDPGDAGDTASTDDATLPDDNAPDENVPDENAPDQSPDAAVEVVRDYYAAINARDFATAYAQWSDGGRASGKTPQQFANGFDGTDGVSVEIGAPGRIEGAAGSRYIEIPVTLDARQSDGSTRRYAGSYTLRMSMVDGATPEQRAWHIASAELREIRQ